MITLFVFEDKRYNYLVTYSFVTEDKTSMYKHLTPCQKLKLPYIK